jgi:RNA recognition motif-containing protein
VLGLQIVVQGIPWKFDWEALKQLFAECGEVERADIMYSPDGRSKVTTGRAGGHQGARCPGG